MGSRRDLYSTLKFGGAERDRTAGLLVANEALSQLSYSPTTFIILPVRDKSGKSGEPDVASAPAGKFITDSY